MNLYEKKSMLLFVLIFTKLCVFSQITFEYNLAKAFVVSGEKQTLNINAKNVPVDAQIFLKINDSNYIMKNNSFYITFHENEQYGYRDLIIDVIVKQKNKIIFKEEKVLEYQFEPEKIAFESSFGNVFFIGLDNHLKIVTNFINRTKLIYSFRGVVAYSNETGLNIRVNDTSLKKATIIVSKKIGIDSSITIVEKDFLISNLPTVNFEISPNLNNIKKHDTSMFLFTNLGAAFNEILNVKIDSFSCQIYTNNKWNKYEGKGSQIKGKLLEQIKSLKSKDILYFDRIYYSTKMNSEIKKTHKTLCLIKS